MTSARASRVRAAPPRGSVLTEGNTSMERPNTTWSCAKVCQGNPSCEQFTQDLKCLDEWMRSGPFTDRATYPFQGERTTQWCADGYHCTCHPHEGETCCRCGAADFSAERPGAVLTVDQARRGGL